MSTQTLLLAAIGGILVGFGLWLVVAVRFARPSLAERLADPMPIAPARRAGTGNEGFAARLGTIGIPILSTLGLPTARTRRDLEVCDRDAARYLAEKFTSLLLGLAAPPAIGAMMSFAGADLPPLPAVGAWALFAVIAWLAPDLSLRDEARKRREAMRHALAGFADLVVVSLAGGAGVNGALTDASTASTGWAMTQIRLTLRTAALNRQPPWVALRELGDRFDVTEFAELSASLQLAGADGARVRGSLAAKARTLRTQHLAELDADAQSATERMSLPVVLLFAGFLVLLGYPAISHVFTSL
ncbi:type II secretion system F family protein [Marinactinospora thermotolerans]|uniref:Type II secretion system (T2SS), protein F n=1 Tax=Marinactinospora thermotolerans DSM 45154 TaxID=1122192 RepID=A0A1T4QAX0_9ACTN|nr:type II secretion system F family protein [Marinactinospora thermotolerans]SKA00845.1 Type II secretion system (T2SS), protein F [Marinactinospora thermotolerans DSM 45154]